MGLSNPPTRESKMKKYEPSFRLVSSVEKGALIRTLAVTEVPCGASHLRGHTEAGFEEADYPAYAIYWGSQMAS